MMGVGKTTVGKALSEHLSMEFLDVDTIIEKKLNLTVQKIFEKKGEAFFREVEEEVTLQTLKDKNTIISLGGGAFMNPKIRDCVISNTKSYWLYLNLDLLEKRLINSRKRPLLINKNIRLDLEKIYNERKSTYSLANYKIDCNKLNDDLIIKKIVQIYVKN